MLEEVVVSECSGAY